MGLRHFLLPMSNLFLSLSFVQATRSRAACAGCCIEPMTGTTRVSSRRGCNPILELIAFLVESLKLSTGRRSLSGDVKIGWGGLASPWLAACKVFFRSFTLSPVLGLCPFTQRTPDRKTNGYSGASRVVCRYFRGHLFQIALSLKMGSPWPGARLWYVSRWMLGRLTCGHLAPAKYNVTSTQ